MSSSESGSSYGIDKDEEDSNVRWYPFIARVRSTPLSMVMERKHVLTSGGVRVVGQADSRMNVRRRAKIEWV